MVKKLIKFFIENINFLKKFFIINITLNLILIFFLIFNNSSDLLFILAFFSFLVSLILILLIVKLPTKIDRLSFLYLIYSICSADETTPKKKKIVGAEVGVFQGNYSEKISKFFLNKMDLELWLIDPWKLNDNYKDYNQNELDSAYNKVLKKFKNKKGIKILREESSIASKKFKDESLDFVYIDGNHEYEDVKNDLNIWFKKLKKNGVLFGDDYSRPYGVHKAVSEFSFENKLIVKFSDSYKQFAIIKN